MTESKPTRFYFDRRTLGVFETTLDVLDGLTIGGASGAGLSAFADKIWISVLLLLGTVALQLLKRGLVSLLSRSLPTPEPKPKTDV